MSGLWCVLALGLAALLGHIIDLAALYRIGHHNMMLPANSLGLVVLAMGLLASQPRVATTQAEMSSSRRINFRVAVIVAFVTICTGTGGFLILRGGVEKSILENIRLAATTNASSLATTLDSRLWFPRTIISRPSVMQSFAKLSVAPNDATTRQFLGAVGDSFLTAGIVYVRFELADGQLVSTSGRSLVTNPISAFPIAAAGLRARLLWEAGFVLDVESDVIVDGKILGTVQTQERLPSFERLVQDIQRSGDSSDVLICGRERDIAVCAPSRFYKTSQRVPMFRADGQLNFPINRALMKQTGEVRTVDLRGVPVLAAYTPIGEFNIGMVVKIDEASAYEPLRARFAEIGLLVILLIVVGAAAVRLQVQPVIFRLVQEQTRNRVILANSNDAFIALDVNGLVRDWNAKAEAVFGWSADEAIGRELAELVIPEPFRLAHTEGLQRFAETGTGPVVNTQIEIMALRRDGTLFPAELSVTGYREGARFVSNAFIRDITSRKAAERRIEDNERFLRTVTDNVPALIAYVDAQERYRFANAMYSPMMGLDPATMIGMTIREVVGDTDYPTVQPHIAAVLQGQAQHFEMAHRHGEGERHLMKDYIPERNRDGVVQGFYIMVTDISERKRAELHQAASERRADLANRAKSDFVANMSHEIRTPMNAVLGITHLLGSTNLTAEQRKYVDMIKRSGSSLMNLLNDILDFSKVEAGKLTIETMPFDLNETLTALASVMTANTGDKPIELAIGVDRGVPQYLLGDRFRLEQILVNIVGNAIKFTADGEVAVLVELSRIDGDIATLRFTISDTGIGMTAVQAQSVFDAFTQADSSTTRRYGGSGLGLSISRRLVELMGGTISLQSEPDAGSKFFVSLPFEVGAADTVKAAMPGLPKQLRIMVVDANATSRQYLCKTISLWGWEAQAASSYEEALYGLMNADEQHHYDLVLADWRPLATGEDSFAVRLRRSGTLERLPIILTMSAHARKTMISPMTDGAASALLLKPVTSSTLFDTVHEVLSSASPRFEPSGDDAVSLRGLRVLLVEDNALNQVVAKGLLTGAGATVEVCENGEEACSRLASGDWPYDVILMNVQMPVMDGLAATRHLRGALGVKTPVIGMSAGVLADERQQCADAGMDGFVGKPIDVDKLLGVLSSYLPSIEPTKPSIALPATSVPAPPSDSAIVDGVFQIDRLLAMSEHHPGQRASLTRLIAGMVTRCPRELENARHLFTAGDAVGASRLIHGLRGSVGTLGAKRFVVAARLLEASVASGDSAVQSHFDASLAELDTTMKAAHRWLISVGAENEI